MYVKTNRTNSDIEFYLIELKLWMIESVHTLL